MDERKEPRVSGWVYAVITAGVLLIAGLIFSAYYLQPRVTVLPPPPQIEQEQSEQGEPPEQQQQQQQQDQQEQHQGDTDIDIQNRQEQHNKQEQRNQQEQEQHIVPKIEKNGHNTVPEGRRNLKQIYDSIKVGMTTDEVKTVVGEPTIVSLTLVENHGFVTLWVYGKGTNKPENDVTAVFKDNEVIAVIKQEYVEGTKGIHAKL